MPVHRSGIEPLQVVERDRRIDGEAEDPCAEEVPEAHGDEAVDRPLVVLEPLASLGETVVVVGLHTDEHQGYDLQCAEGRPEGKHPSRRSAEVEVVAGPEDPP